MSSHGSGGVPLPILQGPPKHKDPVCGMMVAREKPPPDWNTPEKPTTSVRRIVRNGFPTTRKRF